MFLLTMQRYDVFTVCANNLIKNCCFVFALLMCINQKYHNLPENTYCVLLRERTIYARVHNSYRCCTCMMSKYKYVVQYDVLTFCAYFVHLHEDAHVPGLSTRFMRKSRYIRLNALFPKLQ